MATSFDLIVLGAGPGGYVAAIRGAQLGLTVAIIDKRSSLGGTCLNVGCIPSKALLDSSEHYLQATKKFATHGIQVGDLRLDFSQMINRKNDVVNATTQGIDYLMKKNNITVFNGTGSFIDSTTVAINNGKTTTQITGTRIIIATGSEPTPLPFAPFDNKRIISSTETLSLPKLPKQLLVIGGGVIGVELASVYARLGTEVTIIEFMDRLIPTMDKELGKALEKSLKKLGMTFKFKTKVTDIKSTKTGVTVLAEDQSGAQSSFKGDYALVAIGRRPFTLDLNLDVLGIALDDRGRIPVNEQFQTTHPTVYAIGDVIAGPMLAHKASEEGVVCVERMMGQKPHFDLNLVPGVVYTWPEVASVGQTEEALKNKHVDYKSGKFPFKASGRARAAEESDGFVKVLSDKQTDEVLGVHMIGPRVADLIASAVTAMEYRASAEDISRLCAAHPTFSEALKEAALDATENRPIHL